MAKSQGKRFRVQVPSSTAGTPPDPDTNADWESIAVTSSDAFTLTNSEVEDTDKDAGGWRGIFTAGSIKSISATSSFAFADEASHSKLDEVSMNVDPNIDLRLVDLDLGTYKSGNFHIADISRTGETEGFVTADVTFNSNGVVTSGTIA